MRRVWEAIQSIATTGCQWRQPPKDFPPVSTVRHHFYRMGDDGTFTVINELLSVASRIVEGRNGDPTAAIIDSQSVRILNQAVRERMGLRSRWLGCWSDFRLSGRGVKLHLRPSKFPASQQSEKIC
jgi:transposase